MKRIEITLFISMPCLQQPWQDRQWPFWGVFGTGMVFEGNMLPIFSFFLPEQAALYKEGIKERERILFYPYTYSIAFATPVFVWGRLWCFLYFSYRSHCQVEKEK